MKAGWYIGFVSAILTGLLLIPSGFLGTTLILWSPDLHAPLKAYFFTETTILVVFLAVNVIASKPKEYIAFFGGAYKGMFAGVGLGTLLAILYPVMYIIFRF